MDEMSYVLTKMSYVFKKDLNCCLCSCSLFSSLPLIFTLLVASISHLEFLTAAIKFLCFSCNEIYLLCFISRFSSFYVIPLNLV